MWRLVSYCVLAIWMRFAQKLNKIWLKINSKLIQNQYINV